MRAAAITALAFAGCYSPSYDDCQFQCSAGMTCPQGMDCVQGTCRVEGYTGMCGVDADAGSDADNGGGWSAPEDLGLPVGYSDLSITKDGTELFMASFSGQIFVSKNDGTTFATPEAVTELNTSLAVNPYISADGLTLYFASTRLPTDGAADIWRATRVMRDTPFMALTNVGALNSTSDDTGGSTTEDGRFLVLASPHGTSRTDVFASTYNLSSSDWLAPVAIPTINNPLANSGHPCLDGTGTKLVFASDRAGTYDIWMSTRPDRAAQFEAPFPIHAVNSADEEADPCLSTDGETLYFARGPINARKIYRSTYTR